MIYTAIDNFYVTKEQLVNSPSRANGVNEEVEEQLRLYGCELIQEGGCLLKLPQAVMATGQVLFHRFYVKESMKNYSVKVRLGVLHFVPQTIVRRGGTTHSVPPAVSNNF